MIQAELAAAEGWQALHVEAVFHGNGDTMQEAKRFAAHYRCLGAPRGFPGPIRKNTHKSVQPRILGVDLAQMRFDQFGG